MTIGLQNRQNLSSSSHFFASILQVRQAASAYEIRVHILGEWRVIYVAKFAEAVYVLHAFQKKTPKTRKEDIELAARRYKLIGG